MNIADKTILVTGADQRHRAGAWSTEALSPGRHAGVRREPPGRWPTPTGGSRRWPWT